MKEKDETKVNLLWKLPHARLIKVVFLNFKAELKMQNIVLVFIGKCVTKSNK